MDDTLRIAQVSDIHIGPEDIRYYGIDLRANFLAVIEEVKKWQPDLLVLSGDQALDFGEVESYQWLRDQLSLLDIPVLQIPGNHDSVDRMRRVFDLEEFVQDGMLYYKREVKGQTLFFLDSEPDIIPEEQLVWLREEAQKVRGEALLFVHHPPTLCGSQFMDRKWPLRNIPMVQKYLQEITNIRKIFTGHYHTGRTVSLGEKTVYICPSTQMQISESNPDFEIARHEPGWRSIEWDGMHLKTKVHFVPRP
jgi:Icc protein